jgi:hypothetical protein
MSSICRAFDGPGQGVVVAVPASRSRERSRCWRQGSEYRIDRYETPVAYRRLDFGHGRDISQGNLLGSGRPT